MSSALVAPTYAADTVAPTTPGLFANTAVTVTSASFSWTAATDDVAVTAYLLERCTGASCVNFAQIVSTAPLTYTNTSLVPNTTYNYRLRARDAANNKSPYSPTLTVVTPADTQAPTAPSALTITPLTNTQLRLNWAAGTDNVAIKNYLIERCTPVNCTTFAQIASTTTALTYTNTALTPGTSYSYQVRARDAALNVSPYSNIATLSTAVDTQAPTAPTNLTGTTISNTQINLAWTASTDDARVTGYKVERCAGVGCSNFAQITAPTGVTYNNTGLVAGSSYSYRVRATDATGNLSGYSNVVTNATTGADVTKPSTPAGLTATPVSGTQVNLTWMASTDNQGVTSYRVERCTGASCTTYAQIATPTTNSFNDTGRNATTTYRYRVRANDAANNLSSYSTVVNATTTVAVVDCD